jgi:hypothetical protein
MLEQIAEESFNVQTVDISFIELQVEDQMLPLGRNRKRIDGGNCTSLIRVVMHRCFSFWCPSSAQVGNEQKAAFSEENQMGTKFFGFFYTRPLVALSFSDCFLIPLQSSTLWLLTTPSQDLHYFPNIAGMIVYRKLLFYYFSNTLQSP